MRAGRLAELGSQLGLGQGIGALRLHQCLFLGRQCIGQRRGTCLQGLGLLRQVGVHAGRLGGLVGQPAFSCSRLPLVAQELLFQCTLNQVHLQQQRCVLFLQRHRVGAALLNNMSCFSQGCGLALQRSGKLFLRRVAGVVFLHLLLQRGAGARQISSLLGLRLRGISCQLTLVEKQPLQLLLRLVQLLQQQLVLAFQLCHFGTPLIGPLQGRRRCGGLGLQILRQLRLCSLCLRQ